MKLGVIICVTHFPVAAHAAWRTCLLSNPGNVDDDAKWLMSYFSWYISRMEMKCIYLFIPLLCPLKWSTTVIKLQLLSAIKVKQPPTSDWTSLQDALSAVVIVGVFRQLSCRHTRALELVDVVSGLGPTEQLLEAEKLKPAHTCSHTSICRLLG